MNIFVALRNLIVWLNEPVDRPLFPKSTEDWHRILEEHQANKIALVPIHEFFGRRPTEVILSYTRWAIRTHLNDPQAKQALQMGGVYPPDDTDLFQKIMRVVRKLSLKQIDALNRECIRLLDKIGS